MKNIAVIGAGTMGNGIAHTFAQSNFKVNLIDINQDRLDQALNTITKNLDRLVSKGKIEADKKTATLDNLNRMTDLESGLKDVDLVVEAATENLDLKLKIFRDLDKWSPKTAILATNTSSISITKIAASLHCQHQSLLFVEGFLFKELFKGFLSFFKAPKSEDYVHHFV